METEKNNQGHYSKPFINENIPSPAEHPHSHMVDIMGEIRRERIKQDSKWGVQNHSQLTWNAILGEEFGEVSKAILEKDVINYREELIQVAAVAIAAIECLDRGVI